MSFSNASIVRLLNSTPLKAARQSLHKESLVEAAIAIQQIAAPTFYEQRRAVYVKNQFQAIGLLNVEMDEFFNVYGWLPSDEPHAPVLLVSAHTDTVFPAETDLTVRNEDGRICAPGIGDNSLGVAGLIQLARLMILFALPHDASICFLANTREEGLGDLGGIRSAIKTLGDCVKAAIVIEGMALGRIYHSGIAVRRLKITVTAPGGHSWLHFGNPSAIHSLVRFGSDLTYLTMPDDPRTTYNIGLIEGGNSINTIAPQASCHLDLRSKESAALDWLEAQVRQLADKHTTEAVQFAFETVGSRPSGSIPANHPLVRLACDAHHAIHMTPDLESGSTDANALLAAGIPTVCVGIGYGGNAHLTSEYIETAPLEDGLFQLLLLTVAASNALAGW